MTELEILRLVRFGIETLDDYNQGKITDEELERRRDDMRDQLTSANELWERAGK